MHRWERRLKDLAQILHSCHSQYFDPDLFRLNTNQFLQTARTVTFLIQKDKNDIPYFDEWYSSKVTAAWRSDDVMIWAKESRNVIEKQGDLDLHSSISCSLIFSYIEQDDIELQSKEVSLLRANVKRLVRLAEKHLPTGVADSAYIKVERKWVANTLPNYELLSALAYVYARLHDACVSLSNHLGASLNSSIPLPSHFQSMGSDSRRVCLYYLNGKKVNVFEKSEMIFTRGDLENYDAPPAMREIVSPRSLANLQDCVKWYGDIAAITFDKFGDHAPMLFMLNDEFLPTRNIVTNFRNGPDKFAFWREIGDIVSIEKPRCLIWISEAWTRKLSNYPMVAIRNMEITGELLQVCGIERSGNFSSITWRIQRDAGTIKPKLTPVDQNEISPLSKMPNFFIPAARSFGVAL